MTSAGLLAGVGSLTGGFSGSLFAASGLTATLLAGSFTGGFSSSGFTASALLPGELLSTGSLARGTSSFAALADFTGSGDFVTGADTFAGSGSGLLSGAFASPGSGRAATSGLLSGAVVAVTGSFAGAFTSLRGVSTFAAGLPGAGSSRGIGILADFVSSDFANSGFVSSGFVGCVGCVGSGFTSTFGVSVALAGSNFGFTGSTFGSGFVSTFTGLVGFGASIFPGSAFASIFTGLVGFGASIFPGSNFGASIFPGSNFAGSVGFATGFAGSLTAGLADGGVQRPAVPAGLRSSPISPLMLPSVAVVGGSGERDGSGPGVCPAGALGVLAPGLLNVGSGIRVTFVTSPAGSSGRTVPGAGTGTAVARGSAAGCGGRDPDGGSGAAPTFVTSSEPARVGGVIRLGGDFAGGLPIAG